MGEARDVTLSPSVHAYRHPGKPALILGNSGIVITYREMDDRSMQFARFLRQRGLVKGDHIAILMGNEPAYFDAGWAAARSGLYFTPVNHHLQVDEVGYVIGNCDAKVIVASPKTYAVASQATRLAPKVATKVVAGSARDGWESLDTVLSRFPAQPLDDEEEGASMFYSSGTTGRPKGILYNLTGQPFGAGTYADALLTERFPNYLDPDLVFFPPGPLHHGAPLFSAMLAHRHGGTVVLAEHFDAEETLRIIERYRVTFIQLVPTMFVRLLKLPEEIRRRYDVSSLKIAWHAGAPCSISVKRAMIDWWGPILYEHYGATDGGWCGITCQEWLEHPGSVGRPAYPVHILDDEGHEVPPGVSGDIYSEGWPEYSFYKDPEKTKATRNDKGWVTAGDIGYLDENGYLFLTDRRANTIVSGGVNIYPQEVEDLLLDHPAVLDAGVIGVPNEEYGEEVKAVVQLVNPEDASDALARELIEYTRQRLAHYKCPRSVDFDQDLPRLPSGKLLKRRLKDRYWPDRQSRII